MPASSRNPDNHHPPTRLQTHKGPFVFSMWVEVDGKPLPVYHIEEAAEGPEGWIPVVEGKEFVVKHNIRRKHPNTIIPDATSEKYPDFEVTCCVDGDMVDVQLNRLNELRNKEGAGATFEGRQLPRQRMRRLMFSKPQTTKSKTPKIRLDRLGTIEVAWQRCDASHGEEFVNKEKLPSKLVNESDAEAESIDAVTSFGPVETSTKVATNVCGTIHPDDAEDFMSMQLRYVSGHTLVKLGYAKDSILVERPSTIPSRSSPVQNAVNRNGEPSSSRQMQRQKEVDAEMQSEVDSDHGHDSGIMKAVQETKASRKYLFLSDMSVAVTIMNTALKHKIRKLQDGSVSGITAGLPEVQNMSSAINTMCSALQDKLRRVVSDDVDVETASKGTKMIIEVKDMNSAIRVMNMALQDKVKELQGGNATDSATGLQELQAMSTAVHTMNTALQDKLLSEQPIQKVRQKQSPDSTLDDEKFDVRRSTAKRRKIV